MSPAMCWVGGGPAAPDGQPFVGCGGLGCGGLPPCREVGGTPLGGTPFRSPLGPVPSTGNRFNFSTQRRRVMDNLVYMSQDAATVGAKVAEKVREEVGATAPLAYQVE